MIDKKAYALVCFFKGPGYFGMAWHYAFCQTAGTVIIKGNSDTFMRDACVANALDLIDRGESELCLDPPDEHLLQTVLPRDSIIMNSEEVQGLIERLRTLGI